MTLSGANETPPEKVSQVLVICEFNYKFRVNAIVLHMQAFPCLSMWREKSGRPDQFCDDEVHVCVCNQFCHSTIV